MNDEEKRTFKLSVLLLKEEVTSFDQALKEGISVQKRFDLQEEEVIIGQILIGATKSNPPYWLQLIQEAVSEELPDLLNTSNRAILFFNIESRVFALPFGYGKHLLKDELIDRSFGLKTVLNLVNADRLVSIDKANLDDLTVLTRTQTSRKSKPEAFNVDVIKDLLRGVTGEISGPISNELGNIITGNEGISIIPKADFSDIPKNLKILKKAFESDRYKERFDWIDNIQPVKDPVILERLKGSLLEDLQKLDDNAIHLAPPFIMDWDNFEGFSYTPNGDLETDFSIENFFNIRGEELQDLDWDKLLRLRLFFKYGNDEERHSIPLWKCLNYQQTIQNEIFVFALSKWYKVNGSYAEEIYQYVEQFEESDLEYIDCEEGISEGEYNEQLAGSQDSFYLFDKKLIKSELTRSGIEVCDVLSNSLEFIHVKFRSSSATLSHLFAQGRVSAYSLKRDRTYRINLRKELKKHNLNLDLIPIENRHVVTSNYTITFAIIEKKERSFIKALPFFSLINFRLTAEDLSMIGYTVKVKKILIR